MAAAPPARWLDGEVYAHGACFQSIVSVARRTVNVDEARAAALQLHLFDVLSDAPCAERLEALALWYDTALALAPRDALGALQPVHTEALPACETPEALEAAVAAAMDRFVAQGYEGAMLREAGAPYAADKRSTALLKAKRMRQAAVEAYLEARQIKSKYLLSDIDSSDEDEDLVDTEEGSAI